MSTDALDASVDELVRIAEGETSHRRFLRPVAFQDVAGSLLPAALRDDDPLGIPRRVDGQLVVP